MVGKQYEAEGIAKHGAKLVHAVATARVPNGSPSSSVARLVRATMACAAARVQATLPLDVAQRQDWRHGRRAGRQRATVFGRKTERNSKQNSD